MAVPRPARVVFAGVSSRATASCLTEPGRATPYRNYCGPASFRVVTRHRSFSRPLSTSRLLPYSASGCGRIWKRTISLVIPLPPSWCQFVTES